MYQIWHLKRQLSNYSCLNLPISIYLHPFVSAFVSGSFDRSKEPTNTRKKQTGANNNAARCNGATVCLFAIDTTLYIQRLATELWSTSSGAVSYELPAGSGYCPEHQRLQATVDNLEYTYSRAKYGVSNSWTKTTRTVAPKHDCST